MRLALCCAFAAAALGCVGSEASVVPLLTCLAALLVAGCASRAPASADAGPDTRTGGTWETCCTMDDLGTYRIDTCFCPAGSICNYGLTLMFCGDGGSLVTRDASLDAAVTEPVDGGLDSAADPFDASPDADDVGGRAEPCCAVAGGAVGVVTTCFCPAGVTCSYGAFVDCGDGTCSVGDAGGCSPDAGGP